MRILIPTDAFPPVCGGSGWSTLELARGLRSRGHEVTIVQPRPGTPAGVRETEYDGFGVRELGAPAPDIPYVRNYYKNEKLTRSLGNGGPCHLTSHGVPPSRARRSTAASRSTRSREPRRRFSSGRLPTRKRDMPPLPGERCTSGPSAASRA